MIRTINLSKSFGDKKVLKNLCIEIKEGKMTAIVGTSGSGKSTLLNIIGLMDTEFNGKVMIDDCDISNISNRKRPTFIRNTIAYLFQDYALIPSESVYVNLLLALEYSKISKYEKKTLIQDVLAKVGLKSDSKTLVYQLSGGEQQRVALARVILQKGNIVLADEPTGNLDEDNAKVVFEILRELANEGRTVLVVTHNESIANQCDAIVTIS